MEPVVSGINIVNYNVMTDFVAPYLSQNPPTANCDPFFFEILLPDESGELRIPEVTLLDPTDATIATLRVLKSAPFESSFKLKATSFVEVTASVDMFIKVCGDEVVSALSNTEEVYIFKTVSGSSHMMD